MQSVYSVFGSPLHLILDDEVAERYNRATHAFYVAEEKHLEKTGQEWDGTEALFVEWTDEELSVFNKFGDLINTLIELNGGSLDLGVDSLTINYLVKL